ncbi:hypothetical protein H4Q26_007740 [Puccinia striiformis f. sp. tritici PST-130]|nr:hypothetical protein H4Q26_007740 [Puccinia striiformis f. sp. tritici PST-130]
MKSEIGSTTTRETRTSSQIELLYPGSLCIEQELISGLKRRMEESEPYHQKWMKLNLFLSPLTIPCAIIPLIPNLPFFYMIDIPTQVTGGPSRPSRTALTCNRSPARVAPSRNRSPARVALPVTDQSNQSGPSNQHDIHPRGPSTNHNQTHRLCPKLHWSVLPNYTGENPV